MDLNQSHKYLYPKFSNIIEILRWRAEYQGKQRAYTFLEDGDAKETYMTYGEIDRKARAISSLLQEKGARGERVLLFYPSGLDFVVAFFGCLYAGAVAVPCYPPRRKRLLKQVLHIFNRSSVKYVLSTESMKSIILRFLGTDSPLGKIDWLTTDRTATTLAARWHAPDIDGQSLAFLQYTSGSTGDPKGVMVTHDNLIHNQHMIKNAFGTNERSIVVGWLPLYHDMGLIGNILHPLYAGIPCVLMSPMHFIQRPRRWLSAISRYKATISGGPNFAYELCIKNAKLLQRNEIDLSSWCVAFNGAEPIRAATLDRFCKTFGSMGFQKEAFYPCYGLAEATLMVSGGKKSKFPILHRLDAQALKNHAIEELELGKTKTVVGCGSILQNQDVRIVDPETLTECKPGQTGEIWISGPCVAQGYWNQPEETDRTFHATLHEVGDRPYLRSGDLGYVNNGVLFVTGRLKDIIIIRGRNYYPQDIEWTSEHCDPSLKLGGCVAFSIEEDDIEKLIIVQECSKRGHTRWKEITDKIRNTILQEHEIKAHKIVMVRSGSLLRTSSGKIMRSAIRAQFVKGELNILTTDTLEQLGDDEAYLIEPDFLETPFFSDSPQEHQRLVVNHIQEMIAGLLGLSITDIDTNLSLPELGLDSIMAAALSTQIESRFAVSLPFSTLLSDTKITEIAVQVCKRIDEPLCNVDSYENSSINQCKLSYGQEALWAIYKKCPEASAYNIARAFKIEGDLNSEIFENALQNLVNKHSVLRTCFQSVKGKPLQYFKENLKRVLNYEGASEWSKAYLQERLRREANRPFNLEKDDLIRMYLYERSATEHIFLIVIHHSITDFWSLSILFRELEQLYSALLLGDNTYLQESRLLYSDFINWQSQILQEAFGKKQEAYWIKELGYELPILDLPTDHLRPAAFTYQGATQRFCVETELTQGLRDLGKKNGATLYMVLLAAFQIILSRLSNEKKILVGSPVSGRSNKNFSQVLGYFVNTIVLKADLSANPSFVELLARTRKTVINALDNQDYPFSMLVKKLCPVRDISRTPLVQVAFVFQNAPIDSYPGISALALNKEGFKVEFGDLIFKSIEIKEQAAQFDLTLTLAEEDGQLSGALNYNRNLFDTQTMVRISEQFQTLLRGIAADPIRKISETPILSETENYRLLTEWNRNERVTSENVPVHQLFESQAESTPDSIALRQGFSHLTYHELNRRANQVANYLKALDITPETRVGICIERSLQMIIGVLGILKAGGVYVPLDSKLPTDRLGFMIRDTDMGILLTEESLLGTFSHFTDVSKICLDHSSWDEIGRYSPENSISDILPSHLAYVIYTSGSTGKPKGVMVTHRGLTNYLNWCVEEYITKDGYGTVLHSSIGFDLTITSLFAPLISGQTVHLVSQDQSIENLCNAIRTEYAFDFIKLTPSHLDLLKKMLPAGAANHVKTLIIGGELLTEDKLSYWRHNAPNMRLINEYGPTETVVGSCTYTIPRKPLKKDPVPIGLPIENTQIYLLDEYMCPVPIGVIGEVYIGGAGVARGYLNRPDLTGEAFRPNPYSRKPGSRIYKTGDLAFRLPNGNIVAVGRNDSQVKINGFRIETGEIESSVKQHPLVKDSIVVVDETLGRKRLVCYIIPVQSDGGLKRAIYKHLKDRLPDYMVPSSFVEIDSIPLTSNGKIDKQVLPKAIDDRALLGEIFIPPRNETEEVLAQIWSHILGVDKVGVDDNFFELGGDSLLSIRFVSEAAEMGFQLKIKHLFQHQTISSLARVVKKEITIPEEQQGLVVGAVPLTPAQHIFLNYIEASGSNLHHRNMAIMLEVKQPIEDSVLVKAVEKIIKHHDVLRMRFVKTGEQWQQTIVKPDNHVPVTIEDLSGVSVSVQKTIIKEKATKLQGSLNLFEGPLLRIAHFKLGDNQPGRLLIIIHHIVADGVSMRVFVEDLENLCSQLEQAKGIRLPSKTTSFKSWSEKLKNFAESDNVLKGIDIWLPRFRNLSLDVPIDYPDGDNVDGSILSFQANLKKEDTNFLVEVAKTFTVSMTDIIVAALMRAYRSWSGENSLLINMVHHGRHDDLFDEVNLHRTMGNFVLHVPSPVDIGLTSSFEDTLGEVKTQLSGVFDWGLKHSLLRFMRYNDDISSMIQSLPKPKVDFNYQGYIGQRNTESSKFKLTNEPTGPRHGGDGHRSWLLQNDAGIRNGRLYFQCRYSRNLYRELTIQEFVHNIIANLESFCSS